MDSRAILTMEVGFYICHGPYSLWGSMSFWLTRNTDRDSCVFRDLKV